MAIRVPWDKAETALLIDVYLRIEAGQLPMQEAVSVLSHQLRYRAMKAGIKIDEVFRNENEIRMRLGEIQFLMTGGKLGFRNTSSLFKEMVNMKQSDPESFTKILYDARKEIETAGPSKEGFFKWLSNRMTAIQFAEVRFALADLNDYANKKNLIRAPLLETYDLAAIYQIKTTIQTNWWNRTFNKEKYTRMAEACSHYLEYLQLIKQLAGEEARHQHEVARRDERSKRGTTEEPSPSSIVNLPEKSLVSQSSESQLQKETNNKKDSNIADQTEINNSAISSTTSSLGIEQIKNNGSTAGEAGLSFVNLSGKESYSFTTPLYLLYFDKRFEVSNWTELYIKLLACLLKDHRKPISQLANRKFKEGKKPWLGNSTMRARMVRPIQFGENMYAEVNLGANAIVQRISGLLKLCSVDKAQVTIAYRRSGPSTTTTLNSSSQKQIGNNSRNLHERAFWEWMLARGYSKNTVNSYLSALRTVERYAMQAKLSQGNLMEIDDAKEGVSIQAALLADDGFKRMNLKQNNRFRSALLRFIEYLKDTSSSFQSPVVKKEDPNKTIKYDPERNERLLAQTVRVANVQNAIVTSMNQSNRLHMILSKSGLLFVDNRQSGGNLWVIGDQSLMPTMIELRKLGLHFRYRSEGGRATRGKPAWWTRDYLADEALIKQEQQEKEQPKDITAGLPIPVTPTIVESPSVDTTQPTARPVADDPLLQVLAEHFPMGFRLESVIDLRRFRTQWSSKFGTELDLDDKSLQFRLQDLGVAHNGLLYHLDRMLSLEKRQQLLDVIHHWITHEQRLPIYYDALYTAVIDLLKDEGITGPEMLRSCLVAMNPGYYRVEEKYLSVGNRSNDNHIPKVARFLLDQGTPMKLEEIQKGMLHLTLNAIRNAIEGDSNIINSGSNEYFHMAILDISKEQLEEIGRITQQEIDENQYISGNELISLLRERLPHVMSPYAHISEVGLRKALGIWLGHRFSFNGNLVSALDKELSIYDVYVHFCQKHKHFTLQGLYALRDSIGQNPTVYFDAIYDNALRVSEEEFVSKDMAQFDVSLTDAAIGLFFTGEYIPIKAITSFSAFPDAGYPWNEFLLEHYVYEYSLGYRLVHGGFRAGHATGAIVKKDAPYQELHEVLTHDLANSGIALQRENALDYFVKKGYIARMRLTGVEDILLAANKKRNMRG